MSGADKSRVMVVTPTRIELEAGRCHAGAPSIDLVPARVTLTLSSGAQLFAEDRNEATVRVSIPIGQNIALSVDLPRSSLIRV